MPAKPPADEASIEIEVEELTDEEIEREWEEQARHAEDERKAQHEAQEKAAAEEAARLAKEKAAAEEAARLAKEKAAAEEAARLAKEKAEAARMARIAAEKAEEERIARELEEAEQAAREKAEAEAAEAARLAKEKAEAEAAEAARIAREKAEAEAAEAARLAREAAREERGPISLDADRLADELASIVFEEPALHVGTARSYTKSTPPPAKSTPPPAESTPPPAESTPPPAESTPPPPHVMAEAAQRAEAMAAPLLPLDEVPASTPRPKPKDDSRATALATFEDAGEHEAMDDEEPPPISGAVESQRLQKRATAPASEPPPAEVHLLAEAAPAAALHAPSLLESAQEVLEVRADVVRREVVPGPAARFVAASMAFAPATFGELLDASMELGVSVLESMAERE